MWCKAGQTRNRPFCEQINPTHVATVLGSPGSQTVKIENRALRASDWKGMEAEGSNVPGSTTLNRKITSGKKEKQVL